MKLLLPALALAAATTPLLASAADSKPALELKPKAAIMTSAPHSSAPFVAASQPELRLAAESPSAHGPGSSRAWSCQSDHDLCYDANNGGHIVYKPARQFMPDLPGLKPENISIKRDRIIFKYSF
jgi:hypothetical protein